MSTNNMSIITSPSTFSEVGIVAAGNGSCCNGYFVQNCYGTFDFSLLFEQSILSITPSALLLLVVPLRIAQLAQNDHKVKNHFSHWLKLVMCTIFGALQLTLLVLWTQAAASKVKTKVSVVTAVLGLIDALALTVLSHTEHIKSTRPSTIVCVYLLFSSTFDAVQCRTLWLLHGSSVLVAAFTAMLSVKLIMLCLEGRSKRTFLRSQWEHMGLESTSGIMNRGLFWWLNGLLKRGFKSMLSVETLYHTDEKLASERLLHKLRQSWKMHNGMKTNALLISVLTSVKKTLIIAIFPRICLTGFKFAQPFLIHRVISFVEQANGPESKNIAYGLIGATALIYTGIAISTGFYKHNVYRSLTMIRGSLVSLIYAKTIDMGAASAASTGSDTLTLTSTDIDRICSSFENIHELWANPIEIGIALWLLERQLGVACVAPAIVVIFCTIASFYLSTYMGPAQGLWIGSLQKRVGVTARVVSLMKEVKLLGMSNSWLSDIQSLRNQELKLSKKFRMLIVYMNVLGNTAPMLAPVLTFGIFILIARLRTGEVLTVATAFTSLSLLGLLMPVLAQLVATIPSLAASLGCFARIQTFLLITDRDDYRDLITSHIQDTQFSPRSTVELSVGTAGEKQSSDSTALGQAVVVENGSFAVKSSDAPIIQDINIQIPRSTLTVIIGKVGSGKSILLRGLLGETYILSGTIHTSAKEIAYCDQEPWLTNASVKENILAGSVSDEKWYNTVISACALDYDIAKFPRHDQQIIGSKGLSLSGGQKQRVALARALYSRKEIVILDDILSGLDWKTQDHIWNQALGPRGLLRQNGSTVILATHSLRYLRNADKVIVLGGEGRITDQGSMNEINQQSEYIKSLFNEDGFYEQREESIEEAINTPPEIIDVAEEPESGVEDENNPLKSSGDNSLYAYYFNSVGLGYTLIVLGLGCFDKFLVLFTHVWLRFWSEADSSNPGTRTGMYFGIYSMVSIISLCIVGLNVWWVKTRFMFVIVTPRSAKNLHQILLKTVISAPLSFFVSTDLGSIINRFSQDMSLIDMQLPTAMYTTISGALSCIGSAILILIGAKYFAAIIPFALVILYFIQKFYLRTSRQIRILDLEAKSPLYAHLLDTINGLTTVRAFGLESTFHDTNLKLLDLSQRPYYLMFCIQRWLNLVLDLFVGALAVILVTLAVMMPNTTSVGALGVALFNVLGFNEDLAGLISSWTTLETSLGAIARLKLFETRTPAEIQPIQPLDLPTSWPATGRLQISNSTAHYTKVRDPVLHNISLEIQPGEKIAICGRTGSGKTSLLLSLFRLLELDSGAIHIDGISIAEIPTNQLRSRLNAIPQNPTLFPGSTRFNLTPPSVPKADDQTIVSALQKVELWDIISESGGLDVDMSSVSLSQGQKQLVCLARAIIRKDQGKLLVLDEAMSSVDQHTEELMMKVVQEEFAEHTVISVVHRLNTITAFDRVFVLDAGEIVEVGRPSTLLENEGGIFKALWERN